MDILLQFIRKKGATQKIKYTSNCKLEAFRYSKYTNSKTINFNNSLGCNIITNYPDLLKLISVQQFEFEK